MCCVAAVKVAAATLQAATRGATAAAVEAAVATPRVATTLTNLVSLLLGKHFYFVTSMTNAQVEPFFKSI